MPPQGLLWCLGHLPRAHATQPAPPTLLHWLCTLPLSLATPFMPLSCLSPPSSLPHLCQGIADELHGCCSRLLRLLMLLLLPRKRCSLKLCWCWAAAVGGRAGDIAAAHHVNGGAAGLHLLDAGSHCEVCSC